MGRLRERTQYLGIKRKSYRLLKGSVRVLSEKPNNAGLRKEKDRDEKGFKISADFIGTFNNNLSISKLIMFRISLLPMSRSFF
jgi:hypothetical protein